MMHNSLTPKQRFALPQATDHACRCPVSLANLEKLRQLCTDLFAIIEHSADTIFVTDGNGDILYANAAYEQLSGARREDLLGHNVAEFEGGLFSESATLLVLKNRKAITIEQRILRNDRLTYVSSQPVFDSSGAITMVISNNRDFTEIERLRTRLENSEELISKYQLEIEAIKSHFIVDADLVATDKRTLDVLYRLNKLARFDTTVLLLGDTGTGKEEFAKYLHAAGDRKGGPFVKVNCGAIAENLMESEFFGYEKGAFTGAKNEGKLGLFEVAQSGTIFLDEIGELPLDLQVKLLRVIQEREIRRIGGTRPIPVDVRIVSATNRNLAAMVKDRLFREDLFYRLNVASVYIPSLQARRDDIIPLAKNFLNEFNRRYGLNKIISSAVYHALLRYEWPGNVRELRNVVEQAAIMSESEKITLRDLPFCVDESAAAPALEGRVDLGEVLRGIEATYINTAYELCRNVRDAAAHLGMPTATYVRKRKAYAKQA